jgi:predicted site-specific integrase-resolvase
MKSNTLSGKPSKYIIAEYIIAEYIRLSVDDNITESLSISNQKAILDKFIDDLEIPNIEVIVKIDNGYSGTNMERPAVQELLELVRSGGVNMICVKDFSRFSRSAMDSGYFIEQVFPLYGVRFVAVGENFDSDDYKGDTGGIDVAFKFLMHEWYSQDLSKKVSSAKRVQMLRGENIVKNAIYGYRKNNSGCWEPDDEAAEIVRVIYQMALNGLPTAVIRDKLCEMRVPTPLEYIEIKRGKEILPTCHWEARAINRMLTNEQYIGTYIAGKQKSKAIGSHSKDWLDKSEWIVIPDSHTPIVSKEVFVEVQQLLETRLKSSTTAKPMRNILAEDENRVKRAGMLSGERFPNNVIYGYRKNAERELEIDEAAASVIREIFEFARQGLSTEEIKDKLTAAKYPTPSEYIKLAKCKNILPMCQWTNKCVRNLLKNIQLTGAYVSGRIIVDYDTGKKYHTAEKDWVIIPDKYPAIINCELFDEVQKIRADSKSGRKKMRPRDYLLRGDILKCGCCGYSLAYDPLADPIFRCYHTQADPNANCHKMKVNVRELDDAVLAIIQKQAEVVLNSNNLENLQTKNASEQQISDCEKQISKLNEQRQQRYEKFVLSEIERDEYLKTKAEYSAEIERLNKQASALRTEIQSLHIDEKILSIAKKIVGEKIPNKELVATLIDKVYVSPDRHIVIVWKIADFARVG